VTGSRHDWDFPYEPLAGPPCGDAPEPVDAVVATSRPVDRSALEGALGLPEVDLEMLLDRAPLHWVRVRSPAILTPEAMADKLIRAGIPLRYATPARHGSMAIAPRLETSRTMVARPDDWRSVRARAYVDAPAVGARWFIGDAGGVCIDRRLCGTGAGTHLAVIDDDVADLERLDLDGLVRVGIDNPPSGVGHCALMIGWAVGARGEDGKRYDGIAPDASVRAYCIAKPGTDVVGLPLAIARSVFDGADVILCATHVEGTTCPMLDDALDVAARLGRKGRGTVVVLPTGRETSSPAGSLHASLSLGLGDPASDPRVHCVAPGGRHGGWFLWRSATGKLRPFSNRGPAVRWLAPGDDIAHPFSARERFFHAESSGASAIAAGVIALVLGCNPRLRARDVHALLTRTVDRPQSSVPDPDLADPADVLPFGEDRDGHNAKCGYGRLNASRACAAARDPLALELVAMGEDEAASAWCVGDVRPYSVRLARWAVRAILSRPDVEHAARVVLRHGRLIASRSARATAHGRGALALRVAFIVRELAAAPSTPVGMQAELNRMLTTLTGAGGGGEARQIAFDSAAVDFFARLWSSRPPVKTTPELFSTSRFPA